MTKQRQKIGSPVLRFRCPPELKEAVDAVASEEMISASDVVRRSLKNGLQANGVAIKRDRKSATVAA